MDKIPVAFFGTSDRSLPILEALKNSDKIDLVQCITKRDTKVGRHQDIRETEVKKWSKANHVPVTSVSSMSGSELEAVIEQLRSSKAQYGIVADFSFIIPYTLIEFFDGKLINIHFSLLPLYRGASPVQFTILNGDEMAGITFMLIDKKLDTGKIIHQIGYKMAGNETSEDLYKTLFELAGDNIEYVIEHFHNEQLKPREQDHSKATYTYSPTHPKNTFIYKEDAMINWKNDAKRIVQAIRAYYPWPVAWTTLEELENNKKLWLSRLRFRKGLDRKQKVKIHAADTTIDSKVEINELQIEGRTRMDWKTFENGYLVK
jgi:methionyl-tRNA formyltransferase